MPFPPKSGTPKLAKIVLKLLPCCVLVGLIWTPEPVWRALRISCFCFADRKCLYAKNWLILYYAELKSFLLALQRSFLMLMLKFFQRLQYHTLDCLQISLLPIDWHLHQQDLLMLTNQVFCPMSAQKLFQLIKYLLIHYLQLIFWYKSWLIWYPLLCLKDGSCSVSSQYLMEHKHSASLLESALLANLRTIVSLSWKAGKDSCFGFLIVLLLSHKVVSYLLYIIWSQFIEHM